MDEKMQEYRQKLKKEITINAIGVALLLAVQTLAWLGVIRPVAAGEHFQDYWNGFIAGLCFGIMALMLVGIIIDARALKNEQRLRKLYIKWSDERTRAICDKARSTAANIFLLSMLPVTVIAGYFSVTVFFSFLGAELFMAVTTNICKLYYKKTM